MIYIFAVYHLETIYFLKYKYSKFLVNNYFHNLQQKEWNTPINN